MTNIKTYIMTDNVQKYKHMGDTVSYSYTDMENQFGLLEVSWYSLEQYIGCINRQAFNYYCSLLQV